MEKSTTIHEKWDVGWEILVVLKLFVIIIIRKFFLVEWIFVGYSVNKKKLFFWRHFRKQEGGGVNPMSPTKEGVFFFQEKKRRRMIFSYMHLED